MFEINRNLKVDSRVNSGEVGSSSFSRVDSSSEHRSKKVTFTVMRGDVFFCNLGSEVEGSEQFGLRPVAVIQCPAGNLHSSTTIVAAITSKITKAKLPVHVSLESNSWNGLDRDSIVLCEQLRTVSKTRLVSKIGHLSDFEMQQVDRAILISLGLIDITRGQNNDNRIIKNDNKTEEKINKQNEVKVESKKDEFNINRARHLADKIQECQSRINNNSDRSITTKLLRDKMTYISELKMYCKTFNQDHRFYYNPGVSTSISAERGMVVNG